MPSIKDKKVFRAVYFAYRLVKEGKKPRFAIHDASKYYNVPTTDIAPELEKIIAVKEAVCLFKKGHSLTRSLKKAIGIGNVPTRKIDKELKIKEKKKNDSTVPDGSNV